MKLSIIIPTHGRPSVIKDCLTSLQIIKKSIPKPFEIIVINNNNSIIRKDTSLVLKKFKLPILEIKSKPLGSVKARNEGIKKAKGEIIVFFDDDTLIQRDYFTYLLNHYKDKKVGGVGGSEIKKQSSIIHNLFFLFNKPGSITLCGEIISNFNQDYKKSFNVKHLHGSNFSIRKSVIDEIGLMDESMEGHYRDETEYTYRVFEKGYTLIFEPKARAVHTATNIGGNISPTKKKDWAYWYHRNTGYFFFKHLYKNNPLKLVCFLFREFFMAIIRAIIYRNPYYITEIKQLIN